MSFTNSLAAAVDDLKPQYLNDLIDKSEIEGGIIVPNF